MPFGHNLCSLKDETQIKTAVPYEYYEMIEEKSRYGRCRMKNLFHKFWGPEEEKRLGENGKRVLKSLKWNSQVCKCVLAHSSTWEFRVLLEGTGSVCSSKLL